MTARLEGRVAIVTGGGKGIGAVYAQALAREGAAVVCADIDFEAASAQAGRLRAEGGRAVGLQVDVSDPASVESMVTETVRELGRLDILVNNAALFSVLMPKRPFTEITPEDWDRVMQVNVKSLFLCVRAAVEHLKASGKGRVINISSGTALNGTPGFLHYVTSKGAVVALTRALARELGPHNVTVNALAPGLTASETAIGKYAPGEMEAKSKNRCIARIQVPDDLVGTVLFLASDDSAFMTGQTLVVDGGAVFV